MHSVSCTEDIVTSFTRPGQVVMDPFVELFTTAKACIMVEKIFFLWTPNLIKRALVLQFLHRWKVYKADSDQCDRLYKKWWKWHESIRQREMEQIGWIRKCFRAHLLNFQIHKCFPDTLLISCRTHFKTQHFIWWVGGLQYLIGPQSFKAILW